MASTMQASNHLKNKLQEGREASLGCWQMIPGASVSRAMARMGVDFVVVDCEHGNMDDAAMHEAVPAIAACGVSPIVRIADNQGHLVKRALDSGAHGIIVPLLYTPADAISLVRSAKFPPLGSRGFGSPFPMPCFSASLTSTAYLQQANSSLLTIVQIETSEALENVDEIAAVEGIDVLFVGPFDLGNNIARPVVDGVMHEELQVAIQKVLDTAVKRGKKAGIFCTDGLQGGKFRDMGFHMISVATDMFVLPAGVGGELNKARGNGQTVKMSGPYGR